MRSSIIQRLTAILISTAVISSLVGVVLAQSEHPLTGRRIAPTMSISGADWLDRSERELEENPEAAVEAMGLEKGMWVADVGAGTGYFTLRIARRVGPTGRVFASDVQPEMLSRLQEKVEKEKLTNVEPVLGTQTDPKLPAGKLDVVLMVDVYHEFSQPQRMLREMKKALKPTGRLILIEYRKEDPTIPIRPEHKMSVQEVKTEVEAEGYKLVKTSKSLPRQSIFFFERAQ